MKNAPEVHGVDLIKRVASEKIRNESLKKRVWSEASQRWGFFANPTVDHDIFLIMGAAQIGDRFLPIKNSSTIFLTKNNEPIFDISTTIPYVVLGWKQFELNDSIVIGMELLLSTPMMVCYWTAPRKFLFDLAWKLQ